MRIAPPYVVLAYRRCRPKAKAKLETIASSARCKASGDWRWPQCFVPTLDAFCDRSQLNGREPSANMPRLTGHRAAALLRPAGALVVSVPVGSMTARAMVVL